MRVLIVGGSGLIGTALQEHFLRNNHEVLIVTRSKKTSPIKRLQYVLYDGKTIDPNLGEIDVVINLAGAHIADQKWTNDYKKILLSSRLDATNACVEWIKQQVTPPKLLITGSAVGYYGTKRHSQELDEDSGPGDDFLAMTCVQWENAAKPSPIRTCWIRIGVVLANEGGAFPKLLAPYKYYAGGYLGTGEQFFPWIHIADIVKSIQFLIDTETCQGVYNLTAPDLLNNKDFGKKVGAVLGKPSGLPVPAFAVKLMMGEQAMLVLEGQKVKPKRLLEAGYNFEYPTAEVALKQLILSN